MSAQKKDLRKKEKPKPQEKPRDMLCPECGWPVTICSCAAYVEIDGDGV